MTQYKITCKVEFDAGHRIIGHIGGCRFVHGHRYVLQVQLISNNLDDIGMVLDFGEMKRKIKQWVDSNLDHNLILSVEDKKLGGHVAEATGQKVYYMNSHPTAENIALHIKKDILPSLFKEDGVEVGDVILSETPNFHAQV